MSRYSWILILGLLIVPLFNNSYGQFEINLGIGGQHDTQAALKKTYTRTNVGMAYLKSRIQLGFDVAYFSAKDSVTRKSRVRHGGSQSSLYTSYHNQQFIKNQFISIRYMLLADIFNKDRIGFFAGIAINHSIPINSDNSIRTITVSDHTGTYSYTSNDDLLDTRAIHYASLVFSPRYSINERLNIQLDISIGLLYEYRTFDKFNFNSSEIYPKQNEEMYAILSVIPKLSYKL